MISVTHSGDFKNIEQFFNRMKTRDVLSILNKYGKRGVDLLSKNTPRDTGETAESWEYEVSKKEGQYSIYWSNFNDNDGVNIAMIIQYGHGTKNGGYVRGIDYINPALSTIFSEMADELWEEVVHS